MGAITDRNAEMIVIGDVSSTLWEFLEMETACRVRMFAIPRSRKAAAVPAALTSLPPSAFSAHLRELGQAAVIDVRALLGDQEVNPDDMFWAETGHSARISSPALRDAVSTMCGSGLPVLFGDDTLIEAGLRQLVAASWRQKDTPRPFACGIMALP
jgi:hypothetical protein